MNCYRLIQGYVVHAGDPGGPAAWFGALSPWDHVLKDTLFATQEILGDAVAVSAPFEPVVACVLMIAKIYRTYIVWNRNWKIVAPLTVLLIVGISAFSRLIH